MSDKIYYVKLGITQTADKGDFQPFDKIWSPDKCYYMLVLKQHKKEESFQPSGE